MTINFKNILLYLFGILLMGLSVIMLEHSKLGFGSWDLVNSNLRYLTNISLGQASMIVNLCLFVFVSIYYKSMKYLSVLVHILLSGLAIDLWGLVILKNLVVNSLLIRSFLLIVAALLLPFSLSLVIKSSLPKSIFDEATYVFMKIFKFKSFGLTRIYFEVFAITIALVLGFIAKTYFLHLGIGTFVIAFTIGPLVEFYLKLFKKKKSPQSV